MHLPFVRMTTFAACALLLIASLIGMIWHGAFVWPAIGFGILTLIGIRDLFQEKKSVLRNYPILGHIRYFFEMIRPEIRQYLIESDEDEVPFSREARAIVYQRAKGVEDKRPFGTRKRVYDSGYQWLTHSIRPKKITDTDFRVKIGGPDCNQGIASF